MSEEKKPKLLDCTLRDGSYAVDFQFTAEFTKTLCSELDLLGFDYIEIGHGVGIGADKYYRPAIATDFQYAEAASSSVSAAMWGMFAQPHISKLADIRSLYEAGMRFIRIGVDFKNLSRGYELAKQCHDLGLIVFINLMKSYKATKEDFEKVIDSLNQTDFVSGLYLVDSAGGMLTGQIDSLSKLMDEKLSKRIIMGFHGHDNLGLALSHSLLVMKNGFSLIDCTLQGLGRSAGNTSTERLIALMNREGLHTSVDAIAAMKLGESRIRPILPIAGHSGLDTMAGFTLFHTSYMDELLEIALQHRIDPYRLMLEVGSNDLNEIDLDSIIIKLIEQNYKLDFPLPLNRYPGHEQDLL